VCVCDGVCVCVCVCAFGFIYSVSICVCVCGYVGESVCSVVEVVMTTS